MSVEKVWKKRGSPVDNADNVIFFRHIAAQSGRVHRVDAPSTVLSLARLRCGARMHTVPNNRRPRERPVKRIEQTINGRDYLIEVSSVGFDKWRAQIARVPGGSTATMPFYGKTPDEAAGQLSSWLSIAHGQPRPVVVPKPIDT
jgi:hypothetical protein